MKEILNGESSPCNFCVEKNCKQVGSCNCLECKHISECTKYLHASIRITNKCTQKCNHCCFNSSPESTTMMSVEQAKDTAIFLEYNYIHSIQVLGGEFFCNPDWEEILELFLKVVSSVRLVTNGDWAGVSSVENALVRLNQKYEGKIRIAVSQDEYHTNIRLNDAEAFLSSNGFNYVIGNGEDDGENTLIPLGRASFSTGYYSTLGCYCKNPKYQYSFLIDEEGKIYKCSFGVCNYANVGEYLEGGFSARFKSFSMLFNDTFVTSCASCIRVFSSKKEKEMGAIVKLD